jgi:hypothetical protein
MTLMSLFAVSPAGVNFGAVGGRLGPVVPPEVVPAAPVDALEEPVDDPQPDTAASANPNDNKNAFRFAMVFSWARIPASVFGYSSDSS